ncbi:MAG: cation diffusion facilitator family transporter [Alphaproteobacteria bacterium]|nr:MAG: cation diffusion facilitator family transporter [Alphaproteobacteria bacterium]
MTAPDQIPELTAARRATLMRRASRASVVVALTLIAIKTAAWIQTGSVAMLGSLLDSFLDALASGVTVIAVNHALAPADHEHRFGHGKVEAIAGLAQALIITASALYLFVESVQRFFEPRLIAHSDMGIVVIAISIVVTLGLVRYQIIVARLTRSLAVSADSLHYKGDLLMNLGVIGALVLGGMFGVAIADPLIGLAIAGLLVHSSWQIARQSYDMLMDREMPQEDRDRIEEIVLSHPEVKGIHDLRTRSSGISSFIQFHIEMDPSIRLRRAHDISDEVEAAVARAYPDADIIIHADPAGIEEPHDVVEDGLGSRQ